MMFFVALNLSFIFSIAIYVLVTLLKWYMLYELLTDGRLTPPPSFSISMRQERFKEVSNPTDFGGSISGVAVGITIPR